MADISPKQDAPSTSLLSELSNFAKWCGRNPFDAVLLLTITATLVYFFWFYKIFVNGSQSAAFWVWAAWNPEMNQEHGKLVPLLSLGLFWFHRDEIRKALKKGADSGLIFVLMGVVLFVASVRCLQPRMAVAAVPFFIYGSVYYVWGSRVARIILFPCVFLVFMIPVAAVEQATFRLQFIVTGLIGFLSNLVGIQINAVGTTLTAGDGSFNFEIAEGCSGIRSLTAMTMLTAIFVHLTQDRLWKKVTIFCASVLFAIIGNAGRIFTVILVARFYDPAVAGGIYHDYSGYVFFPIAIAAMIGFSKLVNFDYRRWISPESPLPPPGSGPDEESQGDKKPAKTYDY